MKGTPESSVGDRVRIEASSDWQFTEVEARSEANARLHRVLLETVVERTGGVAPSWVISGDLPQLMFAPEARRQEQTEESLKPYGMMYRHRVVLAVRDRTLREWSTAVAERFHDRLERYAAATGLTVLVWLFGLATIFKLDRWTCGYRRTAIIAFVVPLLTCGACAAWMLLLL